MSMIKIIGACIVLLICAIWAGAMWVTTWDEGKKTVSDRDIIRTVLKEMRGENDDS